MSIELEWTSFINDEIPTNAGLLTKAKILPKNLKMRTKKKAFSPEKNCLQKRVIDDGTRLHSISSDRSWKQPDDIEECITASGDENSPSKHPSAHAESYSVPTSNLKPIGDDLKLRVEKSTKVEDKNDDRKWTRDIIFEAEQLIIKSEMDNIEVSKPSSKKKETTDERTEILREPLGAKQMKATEIRQKNISSSMPSLVTDVETFSACSQSYDSRVEERGRPMDFSSNEEEVRSKKSSVLNVARKISRSTSISLKSLNNLGRFGRMKNTKTIPISVKQQQREEGEHALLRAAKNDSVFQIQTLVTHGISTEILDQRGWTPLTIALENENMKCAEVLVQLKADANFVHANGMTVLHHMSSTGMYKGVKFLLRHGANVNAEDYKGWPPVHYAIKQHHLKSTALLLAAGCDSQTYTQKRMKEYEQVVRLATIGKWKYHWQHKLDIDINNEIQL